MPNLNRVMLMGHLTRSVEVRAAGASSVGGFGLAINHKYKTAGGEQREEVVFVDCEAWGKTAEVLAQYVNKGDPLYVEGRLKLDQWDDAKDGSKRSKIKVVVENFQFLKGKGDDAPAARPASKPAARSAPSKGYAGHAPMDEDSVPF